jgi:hypothetical protein
MCFFNELNNNIEEFIVKHVVRGTNNKDQIIDDIYNAESDINEIYYSNNKNFDEELEIIFNKYFSKYDMGTFEILLINIYNVYVLNKIKINEYNSSTYIIKNLI